MDKKSKKEPDSLIDEEMEPFHKWKLRIVTPRIQEHLAYKDEMQEPHHSHHYAHRHSVFQVIPEPEAEITEENLNEGEEQEEQEKEAKI